MAVEEMGAALRQGLGWSPMGAGVEPGGGPGYGVVGVWAWAGTGLSIFAWWESMDKKLGRLGGSSCDVLGSNVLCTSWPVLSLLLN